MRPRGQGRSQGRGEGYSRPSLETSVALCAPPFNPIMLPSNALFCVPKTGCSLGSKGFCTPIAPFNLFSLWH